MKKLSLILLLNLAMSLQLFSANKIWVVNKGVGGHSSKDALARMQRDVIDVKPDWLIVFFGMNDAVNPGKLSTPEEFKSNINKLIENSRNNGINKIVLVNINPVINDVVLARHKGHPIKDLNARILKFNAEIKAISEENNLPLADFYQLVISKGGATESPDCLIRNEANSKSRDGVHPTPEGYKELAKLIVPFLKDIKPGEKVVCFGDSITYGANVKGAGTIYEETYPAWFSLFLNNAISETKMQKPPKTPKQEKGNFVRNGNIEFCSDGVRPDDWGIWKIKGKQEGSIKYSSDNPQAGKGCLEVINENPSAPAYITTKKSTIPKGKTLAVRYWFKGSGEICPMVCQYSKGKFLKTYVPEPDQRWKKAEAEWKEQSFDFLPEENAQKIMIIFRVKGHVFIDSVSIRVEKKKNFNKPLAIKGKAIELQNSHIDLKLYPPSEGGGIYSLSSADGYKFINGGANGLLWKVLLRKIPEEKIKKGYGKLSLDPEQNDGGAMNDDMSSESDEFLRIMSNKVAAKYEIEKRDDSVILRWNGINVKDEKGVLDVWVKITVFANDKFVRIRSGFKNRSKKYTVFYLFSPFVEGIYPEDGKTELDYLASPVFTGRLINNPTENGILSKPERFQPNRSGHSMQFDAYYHGDNGLYMGCFDGEQNIKRYYMKADSSGLTWAMTNVPNNMKEVPQIWETPYDCVFRCFKGDWYDACQIYREWALKQSWTSNGRLADSVSVPKWFQEIDEWFLWGVQKNPQKLLYSPEIMNAFKGLNLGVMAFYWGKGGYFHKMNPDRFPLRPLDKTYVENAQEHSFKIMGYIQGVCWDTDTDSFKKLGAENSVKNYYGQTVVWDFSKSKKDPNVCGIAFPGKAWTELLGGTIMQMSEKAKFNAAYLDSNNHAGTYMNFNPLMSKDSGGGNAYIKANREMMRSIKSEVRKKNPGFCFSAESFWEGNMAELDAYMTCNTTYQYLSKYVYAIPMAHTVYHDYSIFFSAWVGKHGLEEDNASSYIAQNGQAFVWGVKPGWNQPTFLTKYKNHEIALKSSEERYRAYSAGKKFLIYGKMLKEPEAATHQKMLPIKWFRGFSKAFWNIEMPTVLKSAWRAPDGTLGVVLYNISSEKQSLTLKLDHQEYALAKGTSYEASAIYPPEAPSIKLNDKMLSIKIPARSPVVYELK